MTFRSVTVTTLALLCATHAAPAHAPKPTLPELPASARPASRALEINSALRGTYAEVAALGAHAPASDAHVGALQSQLLKLGDLHKDIQQLGAGLGDDLIKRDALRNRALAWLHGWVTFSDLTVRVSRQGNDKLRERLIGPEPTSALYSLLRIHAQMHQAENGAAEPLRERLHDGTGFLFLLGYRQDWGKNEQPKDIPHRYYIPSVSDLVGSPNDQPQENGRKLLSLWALINLQLDTWQDLRASAETLKPLARWMNNLSAEAMNKEWESFGSGGQLLQARAGKLAGFLTFRVEVAQQDRRQTILKNIYDARTKPGKTFREALPDLLPAATPLTVGGRSEQLYDAEIWLRYLVLLSHQEDSRAVADIAKLWREAWGLPGKVGLDLEPAEAAISASGRMPFLRWNQAPVAGHSSLVLHDLTEAALRYKEQAQPQETLKSRLALLAKGNKFLDPYFARNRELTATKVAFAFDKQSQRYHPTPIKPTGIVSGVEDWREAAGAGPLRLTHPAGDWNLPWQMTTTAEEGLRLTKDLQAVSRFLHNSHHMDTMLARAFEDRNPQRISLALRGTTDYAVGPQWTNGRLPQEYFKDYSDELKAAAAELAELAKKAAKEIEAELLVREFRRQQNRYKQAQTELAIARLGKKIAEKGLEISELYRQIADIDTQIAALQKEAAEAIVKAAENKQKAAGLKLAYAARQRDLAEARLQGLIAASKYAAEMVEQAKTELNGLKEQLLEAAQRIEDQKRKSSIFGIIRAVINVVGVALAPFTGGASLAAAQLANMAVDIAQTIDQTDWSNFGSAVQGIGQVAGQAGDAIKFGVGKFGSKGMKKALAGCNAFFKSAEKDFQKFKNTVRNEIAPLLSSGEQLWGEVKKLEKQKVAPFVAAVANGFPITYDAPTKAFQVDLKGARRLLLGETIEKQFDQILTAGGAIFNDAEFRKGSMVRLLSLDRFDPQARNELKAYVESVVKQLPQEVVATLHDDFAAAKTQFQNARQQLANQIESLKDSECLQLAQILAGGMLIIKMDGKVYAVERQLDAKSGEVKQQQERLQKFATAVVQGEIQGLLEKIEKIRTGLNKDAANFAGKNDEKGLRDIANQKVPAKIKEIEGFLDDLQSKINDATEDLEGKEKLQQIAAYDLEAENYLLTDAQLKARIAEKEVLKARLGMDLAEKGLERDQMKVGETDLKIDAQTLGLEVAEAGLESLYLQCLALGRNPFLEGGNQDTPSPEALIRILADAGADPTTVNKRLQVAAMAENLAGMLQWLDLLKGTNKEVNWKTFVDGLSDPDPDGVTKKLGDLAEKAANIYAAKAGEAIEPEFVEIVGIGVKNTSGEVDNGKGGAGPIIQWFKTEKDMARDPWLRQLENKSDLPGRVLGAFDFGFLLKKPAPITPDPEAKEKGPGTPVYRPISPGFASFYLVPSERAIRVRKDVPGHGVAHLTFILVSPDDLLGFPSPADTKNPSPSFKKTVARFKETSAYYNAALLESWKGELKKKLDLKQGLDLTRAVGYWRVYLFSTSSQFDDEPGRQKLVQAYQVNPLELDFFAAYLRIRP